MIRIEGTPHGWRIHGALKGLLLSELCSREGEVVLDLSEVREADTAAVHVLAGLPADRCRLVKCPKWLALWIERERLAQSTPAAP